MLASLIASSSTRSSWSSLSLSSRFECMKMCKRFSRIFFFIFLKNVWGNFSSFCVRFDSFSSHDDYFYKFKFPDDKRRRWKNLRIQLKEVKEGNLFSVLILARATTSTLSLDGKLWTRENRDWVFVSFIGDRKIVGGNFRSLLLRILEFNSISLSSATFRLVNMHAFSQWKWFSHSIVLLHVRTFHISLASSCFPQFSHFLFAISRRRFLFDLKNLFERFSRLDETLLELETKPKTKCDRDGKHQKKVLRDWFRSTMKFFTRKLLHCCCCFSSSSYIASSSSLLLPTLNMSTTSERTTNSRMGGNDWRKE